MIDIKTKLFFKPMDCMLAHFEVKLNYSIDWAGKFLSSEIV